MMFDMTYGQLVYNFTSSTLASMMAPTVIFWIRLYGVAEQYRTALCITGLVRYPIPRSITIGPHMLSRDVYPVY